MVAYSEERNYKQTLWVENMFYYCGNSWHV